MISRIFLLALAVHWSSGQQLQSYLAQQQQQQHHGQQQYRLIPAQTAQRVQVQQYATEEDGRPQQQQYRAAQYQLQYQRPQAGHLLRPAPAQQEQEQLPEDYDPNPQYQFGFDVKDDQFTNYQNRKEQREGDKITGSYSVVDSDGFIRTVTYTADPKEGFKAEVTRTPTDIVVKLPTPPAPQQLQQLQQLSPRQPHPQRLQAVREQQSHQPQHQQQQYVQLSPAQLQHYGLLAAQQKQHLDGAAAASAAPQRYSSQQEYQQQQQPQQQQQAYHLYRQ